MEAPVQKVLIKREDGAAFYSETQEQPGGTYLEGGRQLSPDDVVDGKAVRDWPSGVFTVQTVELKDDHS
jgi:hypothetical protein